MVQLTESSLSKRQQELNTKVNEDISVNVSFEDLVGEKEASDVDRLYKIDIAAKYKKLDYIIETLKSGDSLYISRVLKKCPWLFDDEFSSTLNTDFLHHNIFPFMSIKMKKKVLTAIASNLKNSDRAADFYNYCLQIKLNGSANKFLFNTSESFKLDVLKEKKHINDIFARDEKYEVMKCFFGNSITLFEAYLKNGISNNNTVLNECSYLYAESDVQYLDLLEKYVCMKSYTKVKLGLRTSKHVLTKHKERVRANPMLYIRVLNINKVLRHSTLSDLKEYAVGLLPAEVSQFWNMEYYNKYKPIIHAIPEDERYTFMEKIFKEKYPNEEFDMLKSFYHQGYYKMMTRAERETWALRHIDSNKEILGPGLDYRWYKYVSFEKAFGEIKKMIMIATDTQKRLELLKILVHSSKLQPELEKLLNYFLERHVNENKHNKELFLKSVISVHNVFEININCWEVLNKLFHSVGVYDNNDTRHNPDFKIIAILYNVLNNIDMPEVLEKHIEYEISMYSTKKYIDQLSDENNQRIYDYICNFYIERIKGYSPGTKDHKCIAQIHFFLEFLAIYKKTQKDIPDIIMEFVNHDFESFKYQQILEKKQQKALDVNDLMRFLKKDSKLVMDKIADVKEQINKSWDFRLNALLKKIRIYFTGDVISEKFINLFNDSLNAESLDHRTAAAAVYGLFQLGDEKSKIDLMKKFAPENTKIYETNVNYTKLRTQEAICRFACYSRPPVPLTNTLVYLKGDYVKFCLPMFDMYLSNLPQPECLIFVEALIDAPVSIQKHGLRLAFKCFSTENLRTLVLNAWKKTKNVSLRGVIYKAFFDKAIEVNEKLMFETLKELTLDLHEDDKEELFPTLLSRNLPDEIAGDFIAAVWEVIGMFKNNERNTTRKIAVINRIDDIIHLAKKETIKIICDSHLAEMFSKTDTPKPSSNTICLHHAKWNLIAHYIVYFTENDEDRCESIDMAKFIVNKLVERWNNVVAEDYVNRQLFADFINNLKKLYMLPHPTHASALIADTKSYVNSVIVLETILEYLQKALPLSEIYIFLWDLRISIINRQVVKETMTEYEKDSRLAVIEESATIFGRRLGQLVKEFVHNKAYFTSFTNDVATLIDESAFCMKYYLEVLDETVDLDKDHFLVGISRGLLEVKTLEANLLALQLLPLEPNCNLDIYKSVYTAIRELNEMEVQCCLNKKYCGDFKKRRYE